MGKPVEKCGGHLGVAEDAGPFAECEVGGDDDRGALVEAADQMEEQLPSGLGEGQIAGSDRGAARAAIIRITSYNVCYTKLLR